MTTRSAYFERADGDAVGRVCERAVRRVCEMVP